MALRCRAARTGQKATGISLTASLLSFAASWLTTTVDDVLSILKFNLVGVTLCNSKHLTIFLSEGCMAQRSRCPCGRPSVNEKQEIVGIRDVATVLKAPKQAQEDTSPAKIDVTST